MTLAILKPDHVGDLVLSAAAIRAALQRQPAVLFVATANLPIARLLFPGADIRPIDFPHLSKGRAGAAGYPDLRGFHHVMFLRHDDRITPAWANLRCRSYSFPVDSHDHHQSMIDYGLAAALLGPYDIDALHFGPDLPQLERKATTPPHAIGICIGSGFHANLWPAAHWLALGRALLARGHAVHVVCGPAEAGTGAALAQALGLAPAHLIQGGGDLATFLDRVGALDRVVASDGGAAHLCSLRTPMLSIFGPSPFRRYAPYGRFNRLLTRDLSCSPCCQWTSVLVNGCLSNECLTGITPADVLNALRPPYHLPREGSATVLRPGLALYEGTSHLAIRTKRSLREGQRGGQTVLPTMEGPHHAPTPAPAAPVQGGRLPDARRPPAGTGRTDPDGGSPRRRRRLKEAPADP